MSSSLVRYAQEVKEFQFRPHPITRREGPNDLPASSDHLNDCRECPGWWSYALLGRECVRRGILPFHATPILDDLLLTHTPLWPVLLDRRFKSVWHSDKFSSHYALRIIDFRDAKIPAEISVSTLRQEHRGLNIGIIPAAIALHTWTTFTIIVNHT